MDTILVIAEKPDMGLQIAKALATNFNCELTKKKGYYEVKNYIITYAIGHLVTLAEPQVYNPAFKQFSLSTLPIIPSPFKHVANPKTVDQLNVIGRLIKQASLIINACDAGREGEAIARYILDYWKSTKPFKRLWISSLTPEAIIEGFSNLKDGNLYNGLFDSALARTKADWLIGMNATRAITCTYGNGSLLSIGRVQTPVLALIYDRTKEIENFKTEKYYQMSVIMEQNNTTFIADYIDDDRNLTMTQAKLIGNEIFQQRTSITQLDTKIVTVHAPHLYNLGDLQQDANAKFGFSAAETLALAQTLYETKKVISYPRTNSNYVGADNLKSMHQIFSTFKNMNPSFKEQFSTSVESVVNENNKRICDPSKIEDHHAILPTGKICAFTEDEAKLFVLILKRFTAQFFEPALFEQTEIKLNYFDKYFFSKRSKSVKREGWRVIYNDSEEFNEEENINPLAHLDTTKLAQCIGIKGTPKSTKAPSPFTEGTLIKAMMRAGRNITDEELRSESMKLELGTSATRHNMIEILKSRQYIIINKKSILLTEQGKALIELLRANPNLNVLTNAELTAKWELHLSKIALNQADAKRFMENAIEFTERMVSAISSTSGEAIPAFSNDFCTCPRCNGKIQKNGHSYSCKDCSLTLKSYYFGKQMSEKMIQDLFTKGHTSTMKFTSKKVPDKPTEYSAKLVLDHKEWIVKLDFAKTKKR